MSDKTILDNNSQVTVLDNSQTVIEDASLTVIDSDALASEKQTFKLETFLDYKIIRQLETEGAEADIYVVAKDDNEYILKLYRYGIEPKQEIVKTLLYLSKKFPEDIVKIYEIDFHNETSRWYEIQEYAKYGSLRDLDISSLKLSEIKQIVAQINSILSSLHNNGIIHRDLKPANILIRSNSPLDLIMTDFGISSVLDEEMSKKMTSKSGTRIYFAPESFSGVIGKEVDLWAFGIILLELITSENIFHGINEGLIAYEIHTKGVAVPEKIDSNLATLLKGLLTRDPKKRWSVNEVAQWLKGKTDIPLYYDYSSETTQGYEKPYIFNEVKYYTLKELVAEFAESQENWENGLAHYYRGYISKWLENNEDYDTSITTDKLKEETEDRDFALLQLIYMYNQDLDFIVYGKLVNLNNLLLLIGKYLNATANKYETLLVENISNGKLSEYYDKYRELTQQDKDLASLFLCLSEITQDLDKENGKQLYIHNLYKYLEIMQKKDNYYFPYGLENIDPDTIVDNYKNFDSLLTKKEYEELDKKYFLPLSMIEQLNSWDSLTVYFRIKEKYQTGSLINKEDFRNIDTKINVYQSVDLTSTDDQLYAEILEFVKSGHHKLKNFINNYTTYVLPSSFEKILKNQMKEVYDNLEFLTYFQKKDYNQYKKEYFLPKEVEKLEETASLNVFIKRIKEWKEIEEKKEFIRKNCVILDKFKELKIDTKKMFDLQSDFLEDTLVYRKAAKLLIEYKDKLSVYLNNLDDFFLPIDFEEICKSSPKLLLSLAKESVEKNYILPREFQNLDNLNSSDYLITIENIREHISGLLTKKEFEFLLQEKELVNYFELQDITVENITLKDYRKLLRIKEIISSQDREEYLDAIKISLSIKTSKGTTAQVKEYLRCILYGKKILQLNDKKIVKHIKKYENVVKNAFYKNYKHYVDIIAGIFFLWIILTNLKKFFFLENFNYFILILPIISYWLSDTIYYYKRFLTDKISIYLESEPFYVKGHIRDILVWCNPEYKVVSLEEEEKKFRNYLTGISIIFILLFYISSYYAKQRFPEHVRYKISEAPYERGMKYYDYKQYKMAYKVFTNDVNKNNPQALIKLGNMYFNGQGVKKDYSKALEFYEKAATQGDSIAQNILGNIYFNGRVVKQNYKKAIEYYQQSADNYYHWGLYNLGNMYFNGLGVKKDYSKALEFYEKAAKQGDSTAQNALGDMYFNGYGVIQNYKQAIKYYQESADNGNSGGQYEIGNMYYSGKGVKQDYKKAIKYFELAANQGNSYAQGALGNMYILGLGVKKDCSKALKLIKKAVKQGNFAAQTTLGSMYENGKCVKKDYQKAIKYYELAANQGNSYAQGALGDMYLDGHGVKKNYKKAIEYYQQSADNGNSSGYYQIGYMYYNGKGVKKDYSKALEFFKKAVKQGNFAAQTMLGIMYYNGQAVKKDYAKALEFFNKAAKSFNYIAQYYLGNIYYKGQGVKKDYNKAVKYYKLSANQGYTKAKKLLDQIEKQRGQ